MEKMTGTIATRPQLDRLMDKVRNQLIKNAEFDEQTLHFYD